MAGTLNYSFDPNQLVHVLVEIDDPNNRHHRILAVRPGKVVRVRFNVLVTKTTLLYDIEIDRNAGTTEVEEKNVFATLSDAVAEYALRLQ